VFDALLSILAQRVCGASISYALKFEEIDIERN
jgi:hypothetical protein